MNNFEFNKHLKLYNNDKSGKFSKIPSLKKHYILLYQEIIQYSFDNDLTKLLFKYQVWHYFNKIKNVPTCLNDFCSKSTKFYKKKYGYTSYCCSKCAGVSTLRLNKIKHTNLKRYGVKAPAQCKVVQDKMKATNLKKYGYNNAAQSKVVQDKMKKTNLERYGHENVYQSDKIKEKIKATNLKRYGFKYTLQIPEIRKKINNTNLKKYDQKIKKDINIIDFNYENRIITYKCEICNKTTTLTYSFYAQRKYRCKLNPCLVCLPLNTNKSGGELQVFNFVKNNYFGSIIRNDRKSIKKELDILLKDLNLAFEYNGVYWHTEKRKSKNYHLNKTERCLQQNIKLIHIWEDDWKLKQCILKSRILHLLNKTQVKIYARKCEIKEINTKQARIFINENHLQEYRNSSIKIGLFYESALVSLMTYRKTHSLMNSYELDVFCSKLNMVVVGGASKMFKYYVKKYDVEYVVSYFDRSWGQSTLHKQLEFNFICNTKIDYYCVVDGIRKLTSNLKYSRIFNSGNEKWIWKKDLIKI